MKKFFKWIGIVLGSLTGLIFITALTLFLIGNARLNKTYDFPATNLEIPTDAESLEYGKHRVETLCAGCHGPDLSGIENWFDGGPMGTIDSANLTTGEGGIGDDFTAEDFVRAVRHGIDQDGKPNFMIAVGSTSYLSDEDLASIIAYVQTVPPVDHVLAGKKFTPLAKMLLAAGIFAECTGGTGYPRNPCQCARAGCERRIWGIHGEYQRLPHLSWTGTEWRPIPRPDHYVHFSESDAWRRTCLLDGGGFHQYDPYRYETERLWVESQTHAVGGIPQPP
jgi:mono/diheme cytochrome c family protein